jgi:predicted nicotinamide N-methyase
LCSKLDWTRVREPGYFEQVTLQDAEASVKGFLRKDSKLDVIIGTDVVYWRSFVSPLVDTLDALFDLNEKLIFYICYIERHKITHIELLEQLEKRNYTVIEIG